MPKKNISYTLRFFMIFRLFLQYIQPYNGLISCTDHQHLAKKLIELAKAMSCNLERYFDLFALPPIVYSKHTTCRT